MSYVDGFVIPVPAGKKAQYREMCTKAAQVFKEYGATQIVECWGDDVPDGQTTDFKRAVKAESGEAVVFSWIVWPSKAVRDESNARIKDDPRMQMTPDCAPPNDSCKVRDVKFAGGANNHLLVSIAQAFGVETDTFGAGPDNAFTTGALSGLT